MAVATGRAEKRAAKEFETLKKQAADARLPFDKNFLLNIAFFLGQQYSVWNDTTNAIETARRPDGLKNAPRPVVNKITHYVMKQRASALESKPTIDVRPATDDSADITIASVALNWLNWLSEPQAADVDGELAEATLWALAGGESYQKWTWPKGSDMPDVMACSGLEVFGDPYARNFTKGRFAIHEQYLDVDQARFAYDKDDLEPTTRSQTDLMKAAVLRDMGMAPVLQGVLVNELWVKPNMDRRWPDGKMVVWTGDTILYESDDKYPYDHGRLPFTQIGSIPIPGKPHYTCSVTNQRSPSMELNKFHAQRIATREAFANFKWWIPDELELEADPDDSPNQILRGNSSGGQYTPSIIQPPTFTTPDDGEWLVDELNDAAGQHETSRGQVPGRVEAARAIEMLKQADDSHLAELNRTIGTSLSDGGYMSLMLLKQFGTAEQVVQTYTREGIPEVKKFFTTAIKPGMVVKIGNTSGLATTRAARQDQALLMWQNQIITDPDVMAELMEIPVGRTSPQKAIDVRLARNENYIIAEDDPEEIKKRLGKAELKDHEQYGIALTPNSWDDHDIHIRVHNEYRKSSEYDDLTIEAQQKFEYHVQTHKDLRMQAMKEQMEEQALAQGVGAPVPSGGPNGTSPSPVPVEEEDAPAEDQAAATPIAGMPT